MEPDSVTTYLRAAGGETAGISGGGSDARASGVAERAWPRDGSHPSGGPTGSGARRECWWLEQQVGSSAGAAASGGRRHDERGGSEGGG